MYLRELRLANLEFNAMITNQTIESNLSTLQKSHYVLASAHPRAADRFHVGPGRGTLRTYRETYGDNFALVLWKSTKKSPSFPLAFLVIPIVRVINEFTDERITRKDATSWNAHVLVGGRFRTSEENDRFVDVRDCFGEFELPQRILSATLAGDTATMEWALKALGGQ